MDTTPNKKMFDAMRAFTDAMCGEEPHPMLVGSAANAIRDRRRMCMDWLHQMVTLCMREGVNRKVRELQQLRDPVARTKDQKDVEARAREDAQDPSAGRIVLPH